MISNLQFIIIPLLASLVLLAATSYFGIHVLKREIIFIDIALAQIAVLGGVASLWFEELLHSTEPLAGDLYLEEVVAYSFSLVFCLGAALVFTYLKNPKIKVPIEAFIGIAYAVATTAAVIILDKGAGGDVHLHDMLTGVLLWATWPDVLRLTIIFILIGAFHYLFRKKFTKLSEFHHGDSEAPDNQRLWDFLFYFSFGIVIIEAVRIAGVLTVFAFLILPASISALFSTSWKHRMLIGLISGIIAAFLGLHFSISLDLTASPLIILFLGIILLVAIVTRKFPGSKQSVK
jgi:zinc/manganese transport system permease protein